MTYNVFDGTLSLTQSINQPSMKAARSHAVRAYLPAVAGTELHRLATETMACQKLAKRIHAAVSK